MADTAIDRTILSNQQSAQDTLPTLEDFVYTVLLDHGFGDLPEEEQQRLLPGFTEQALVRLSSALAPKLTNEGLDVFSALSTSSAATPDAWETFWRMYVPDFSQLAKETLEHYVEEISVLLTA